ncbi:hypothetical protein ACTFIW_003481 [Dictyostelium discoideum]
MKIIFFLIGIIGDVQPSIILANELNKRGHKILIVCEENTKFLTDHYKLENNILKCHINDKNKIKKQTNNNNNLILNKKSSIENDDNYHQRLNQFYLSSIGYDLVICNYYCITEALCIRDKSGIPFIPLIGTPILKTALFPHIHFSDQNLSIPALNKLTYNREYLNHSKNEIERVDKWRKEYLQLDGLKENFFEKILFDPNVNIINTFDQLILPGGNGIPHDYLDKWNVVGFINNQEPRLIDSNSEKLLNFLNIETISNGCIIVDTNSKYQDKKDLPIIFEFHYDENSDNTDDHDHDHHHDHHHHHQEIIPILKYTIEKFGNNQKWIILNSGNSQNEICLENVININNFKNDYQWIYKYCSLSISYGGNMNSISGVLKSSLPSIITSLSFDQSTWAKRIESMGIGIGLKSSTLKKDDLFNSILSIKENYEKIKNRCTDISNQLSNDSIEKSITLIENKKSFSQQYQQRHQQQKQQEQQLKQYLQKQRKIRI